MTERYRPRPHLREQQLGEEIMVFDAETDRVHVLNESAAVIWEGLKAGLDGPGIEGRLREQYDLGGHNDPAAVIRDSIQSMVDKGLLGPAASADEKEP